MTYRILAAALAVTLLGGCRVPWRGESADERNVVFALERNQIVLPGTRINGRPARVILDTASAVTTVDRGVETGTKARFELGQAVVETRPEQADLRGMAHAFLGGDIWRGKTLSIDYRRGLMTISTRRPDMTDQFLTSFRGLPQVEIRVDGRAVTALVDTTSPDTLTLPAAGASVERREAVVEIAGERVTTDIAFAPVTQARIGNRLLSRYLVTIDTGRGVVALWRNASSASSAVVDSRR